MQTDQLVSKLLNEHRIVLDDLTALCARIKNKMSDDQVKQFSQIVLKSIEADSAAVASHSLYCLSFVAEELAEIEKATDGEAKAKVHSLLAKVDKTLAVVRACAGKQNS